MSASPSPLVRLLAWVTVSAFLLTGAPDSRSPSGLKSRPQWAPVADELAQVLAPVGPVQPHGGAPLPLSKVRDAVAAPNAAFLGAPRVLCPGQLKSSRVRLTVVPRLRLVGQVELRI